jgi:signal transduction histidine kinase
MIGRLAAAVLIAIAAFLPPRRLPARRLTALVAGLLTVSVVAVIALPVALLSDRLPGGLGVTVSPATFSGQAFTAQLSVSWPHLVTMVVYAAAAIGFTRRAAKGDDELMCWLAAGVALHVVASLNYALYPSLYSEWVYTGDVFRLLFYLVLLGGAAREIRRYWREQAKVAVLEERRRIARELHDGLAQELAFIARRSRRLVDGGPASSIGGQVAAAADRALDEARRAIAALTRPLDEPLEQTLAQAVEEVAARSGTRLELDLAPGIRLAPSTREALVRIAREAVSNAGRHACASVVQVQLADDREPRLVVSDDGVGFDPAALQPSADGGFGLTSMRERADAVGADFLLTTSPGRGTRIEVVFA